MSYNGSGTFQINTSGQPVVAGTVISSTAFNALTADLATGLSTAITKDGQTTTTARIPFAAGISSTLVTDSSSTTTGSIITAGGVGIAKALYVGTTANIAGTTNLAGLTASSAVATDASKNLVSVTNTGTGNNVLATSPTLVTPILGTPTSGSLVNCTDLNYTGFKNRIINGAMVIDQRNAGAATANTYQGYNLDRWFNDQSVVGKYTIQQNAGSITPPVGFVNYLGVTSSSAYSIVASDYYLLIQYIEGYNIADLGWGTANAKTVTLSFQVYSSLTGTFGGSLRNSAANRSYPFSYTISSANTWTSVSVTIAGDTTGTWLTTNGKGINLTFGIGAGSTYSGTAGSWSASNYVSATGATSVVGTNGATFYITGVQLEKGSTATSFDYRPYGTELQLAQRYYQGAIGSGAFGACRVVNASTAIFVPWATTMRAAPTFTLTGSSVVFAVPGAANYTYTSATISTTGSETTTSSYVYIGGSSTVTVGTLSFLTQGYINASSEL